MNRERILYAIELMKQVRDEGKKLDMTGWQQSDTPAKDFHTCGTACCFGGWLAISPKFKQDGGRIGCFGAPMFGEDILTDQEYLLRDVGSQAIANYLEIDEDASDHLCAIICSIPNEFYAHRLETEDITPDDVINALQTILNSEE